jgi:hypothetical protein
MKNKNNKCLSVLVSVILTLAFATFPSSFSQSSQSTKDSTSSGSPFNTLPKLQTNSADYIHIMKTSTNSYNIIDGQTVFTGTFGTTYAVTGSSNSLNKSKDLIISTIEDDFNSSPTIGYVRAGNTSEVSGLGANIPNPFADQQRINSTIAQELSRAIGSAHSLNFTIAAIECNFGMNIENWRCEDYSISD